MAFTTDATDADAAAKATAEAADGTSSATAEAAAAGFGNLTLLATCLVVLAATAYLVYTRRKAARESLSGAADAIFTSGLTDDGIARLIAEKAGDMLEQSEDSKVDLDALGPTGWPDMPNVTLIAVLEELLAVGIEAGTLNDHHGAKLAFDEALELEDMARDEKLQRADTVPPLRQAITKLLLRRSMTHVHLGDEDAQKRDVAEALALDG